MSNKHGSQFAEQSYYISSATPADGDAVLGQLWIDPDDGKVYRVTSLGPIVFTELVGGGAPSDVDYLVGTADGDLSAEIVVGTTPGGELGNTWASPTVDSTHSGSAHHSSITLAGSLDYLTLSSQEITRNAIDLATDITGKLPYANIADLTDGNILVGNGSNVPTSVNPSGDVDVDNAGVFSIASGVIVNADVNASAAIVGSKLVAATAAARGAVELAIASEVTTGTDATRAVTPDGLAGSDVMGGRGIQVRVFDVGTDNATGDKKATFRVDQRLVGMNIVDVHAEVDTAGTTGTQDIQLRNVTQAADILSTKLTVDSGETGSDTAATAAVISGTEDDLQLNDVIAIDVDAVQTTAAKGLLVTIGCRLP